MANVRKKLVEMNDKACEKEYIDKEAYLSEIRDMGFLPALVTRAVDRHTVRGFLANVTNAPDKMDFCGVLCDFSEGIINRQKADIKRLEENISSLQETIRKGGRG